MKFKTYIKQVLIGIDQLFNTLIGGYADETLSSRTYRGACLADNPKKRWTVLYRLINAVFFDKNHCRDSYFSEIKRSQHSPTFRESLND